MKNILVAVDFSDVTEEQFRVVDQLLEPDGRVEILHVLNPVPEYMGYGAYTSTPDMSLEDQVRTLEGMVGELQHLISTKGAVLKSQLLEGDAVPKIIKAAADFEADLVVLGSHGHGALYDLLVGSVAEGVLRKIHCPVLIVPARKTKEA